MIYTVGFLVVTGEMSIDYDYKNQPWKILLLRKSYPRDHRLFWMDGCLNGIGGKLEDGELPDDCMKREFFEETGIVVNNWELFCITEKTSGGNEGDEVYFYKGYIDNINSLPELNDSGEKLELVDFSTSYSRDDIVDNLSWLIPLAFRDKAKLLAEILYKG